MKCWGPPPNKYPLLINTLSSPHALSTLKPHLLFHSQASPFPSSLFFFPSFFTVGMDDNKKMQNLKYILKWTGGFVTTLTIICGLTNLPFKKDLIKFEANIDSVMEAAVYSAFGFVVTGVFDLLAQASIKRKYRYSTQMIFYISCGIGYIFSSFKFSVTFFLSYAC